MRPCATCGRPCPGKAGTCSPECRLARRRDDQRRSRERRRGPRRCVVCGATVTAKTATNVCSPACRRARRLGVPPDRLPPLTPLAASAVCDVCGREFAPWVAGQKGCSPDCMRVGRLRRKLEATRKGPYPPRPCAVCGEEFTPDRKNGRVCPKPECRAQRKRDLAAERSAGVLRPGPTRIFCTVCGDEVHAQANAKTCARRECLLERRRLVDRATRGTAMCACIVCGERFWPPPGKPGARYTCSDACRSIAARRKNRRGYEAHREERLAEQDQRMRDDPAYREHRRQIDREYRRRRDAARAETEAATIAAELHRRLDRVQDH